MGQLVDLTTIQERPTCNIQSVRTYEQRGIASTSVEQTYITIHDSELCENYLSLYGPLSGIPVTRPCDVIP